MLYLLLSNLLPPTLTWCLPFDQLVGDDAHCGYGNQENQWCSNDKTPSPVSNWERNTVSMSLCNFCIDICNVQQTQKKKHHLQSGHMILLPQRAGSDRHTYREKNSFSIYFAIYIYICDRSHGPYASSIHTFFVLLILLRVVGNLWVYHRAIVVEDRGHPEGSAKPSQSAITPTHTQREKNHHTWTHSPEVKKGRVTVISTSLIPSSCRTSITVITDIIN